MGLLALIASKRTPPKRTLESDLDSTFAKTLQIAILIRENASKLPPMTPGTCEKQVNCLLTKATQHRGLALLINCIRASAHHSSGEVAKLRLMAAFSGEVRSYLCPTILG
jgi:hypothetical protein